MVRVLILIVLAFGVLARSFIEIQGEVHEASHLYAAGAEHASELHDASDDSASPGVWHQLLHTDHCCGHGVAPIPSVPSQVRIATAIDRAVSIPHRYRSLTLHPLHRPPILT